MDKNKEKKIIEASKKDMEKFEPLYRYYKPHMDKFFKYRVNDTYTQEELTSKTFEKAIKGLDNFQWQGLSFSAWLYRIARNTLIDYYRKNSNKKNIQINDEDIAVSNEKQPLEVLIDTFTQEKLLHLLEELPLRERNIIYLKFFDGYTNKTISKLTGLTETNVGTILFRAIKKLRNVYLD